METHRSKTAKMLMPTVFQVVSKVRESVWTYSYEVTYYTVGFSQLASLAYLIRRGPMVALTSSTLHCLGTQMPI